MIKNIVHKHSSPGYKSYAIRIGIIVCLFFCVGFDDANGLDKLVVKGTYTHEATGIQFPASFYTFERRSVEMDGDGASINYFSNHSRENCWINISIYPAGDATEERLPDAYRGLLARAINRRPETPRFTAFMYFLEQGGYNIPGLTSTFEKEKGLSSLTLFECGKFFVKYKISAERGDSGRLAILRDTVMQRFPPADVVKAAPLPDSATVHIFSDIDHDSTCVGILIEAGNKKLEWLRNNVDARYWRCGVPGMYMEAYRQYYLALVAAWNKKPSKSCALVPYFTEIIRIITAGYLNEYIITNHSGPMILGPGVQIHYAEYQKWRSEHPYKTDPFFFPYYSTIECVNKDKRNRWGKKY